MAGTNICKDIFEVIYANVKRSLLESFDVTRVKSRTLEGSASEEGNVRKTTTFEPDAQLQTDSKESSDSVTETVRESVERVQESTVTSDMRAEMEEKFPFMLAAVCSELACLDVAWRRARDLESQPLFSPVFIDVVDEFPLSERFVHPAVMFISSMMLIDVNEKRSDAFYKRYVDAVSKIVSDVPFEVGKTVQKYS